MDSINFSQLDGCFLFLAPIYNKIKTFFGHGRNLLPISSGPVLKTMTGNE
ncbi:hypothetical protein D1AOALGA4SA_7883 [Olavius algarvensis Delta 1 endosymbiont]|nr:hypothetical protein D1AOALGA4SA_7883 [Olavius algarvensis Delta 1 endosymbiont]